MYTYNASLIRVVDGDTVWLRVDLGFRMFAELSFRMASINTPELNQVGGAAARDALTVLLLALGPVFTIQTSKPDKYGRWLVTIPDPATPLYTVNERMVADGHAVPYMV